MEISFCYAHHRQQFEEKGYLIVDLLAKPDVENLLQFYNSLHHNHKTDYGFHVSLDNTDPGFVSQINHHIVTLLQERMLQWFNNSRLFSGRFLVKDPNRLGLVTPHQDWSFTDETQSVSATVWVPLTEVGIQNGAIGVIEGSHLLYTGIRATPLPIFKVPFNDCAPQIFSHLKIINLQAGQALVMNNRLIHGSPPNLGRQPRIAVGAEIMPQFAPLYHYYLHPVSEQVVQYEIDDTFFYQYSNAKLLQLYQNKQVPHGLKTTGTFPYNPAQQPWEAVKQIIQTKFAHPYQPLLQQIFDYSYQLSNQNPFEAALQTQTNGLPESSVWSWVKNRLKQAGL